MLEFLSTFDKSVAVAADAVRGHTQKIVWGYGCSDLPKACRNYVLQDILHREMLREKHGYSCLNEIEEKKIREEVNLESFGKIEGTRNAYKGRRDVWMYNNPSCIQLEHYEIYCRSLICDLEAEGFSVNIINNLCKLDLQGVVAIQNCTLAATAFVILDNCDLDFNVDITEEKCDLSIGKFAAIRQGCELDVEGVKATISNIQSNC